MATVALASLTTVSGLAGCGASSSNPSSDRAAASASTAAVTVSGAYIPLPSMPDMAAGYFVVRNGGGTAVTLTGVTSPEAGSVTMHESTATTMVDLQQVTVPAHGSVAFARGGRHLMLMGLHPQPKVGERVELKLAFQGAPPVTVEATVQPMTYQPDQSGQ
ncbi:copper chaperone PCu(A)C [Streptacidiphilus rugosus]|uniref:copper chaperone PCu(A)C n=1 Tax=Streptacidiphilus rugosus TaxID=405783 RepID=UPI00068AE3F3|nr:copper chaperone PCu(A)C [Streptacidiphilus rugosus]